MKSRLVTYENCDKYWYNDLGERHREDEPAVINATGKFWFSCDRCHRIDGPAIEWADGTKDWYINGLCYKSKEEWFAALTSEQKYNYIWNM